MAGIIARVVWGAGSCEWGAECLMHMCIIGLNRMKDVLTSAEHFRIPAAVSQMSFSWTFAIANGFLKQERKVTFPVCAADKVTPFIRGGQWDVFRWCFSFFCQTNSVLLVTYLPPSRSCVMCDNIRKVDQCFLTIICIQIALFPLCRSN